MENLRKITTRVFQTVIVAMFFCLVSCSDPNSNTPTQKEPTEKKEVTLKDQLNSVASGGTIDFSKAEIKVDANGTYTITKPLTIKNGDVKNATFIIKSKDVVFEKLENVDDVTITEQVDDGDFTIKSCGEVKKIMVNGGGANSIHIKGTQIKQLAANKTNARIALSEADGVPALIGECLALKPTTFDAEKNTCEISTIIVEKNVTEVTFKGKIAIEEVFTTATTNTAVKTTFKTTGNAKIASADNTLALNNFVTVDSEGKETEATVNIKFEDKTKAKEDVLIEIKETQKQIENTISGLEPTYKVDLTEYLYTATLAQNEWSNKAYETSFDITRAFGEKLPKAGEVIEYSFTGTFTNKISSLRVQFADQSQEVSWWKQLVDLTYIDGEINEMEELTITRKAMVVGDAVNAVGIHISYVNTVLDEETIFIPKGWKVPGPDPDPVSIKSAVRKFLITESASSAGAQNLIMYISDGVPESGELKDAPFAPKFKNAEFTYTINDGTKITKKLDIIQFFSISPNNDKTKISYFQTEAAVFDDVKLEFGDIVTISFIADAVYEAEIKEVRANIIDRSEAAGYWKGMSGQFDLMNNDANEYSIDISDLVAGKSFGDWGDQYGLVIDLKSKFADVENLKQGDYISYTLSGVLTQDIKNITAYLERYLNEDDKQYNGNNRITIDENKAAPEFGLTGEGILWDDVKEGGTLRLIMNYSKDECNKQVAFLAADSKVYDIGDISDLLPKDRFGHWEDYYYSQIDISSKLPAGTTLKQGDIVKFTFVAKLDADIGVLSATIKGSETWLNAKIPNLAKDIKAGTEFEAGGNCFIGETPEEDEAIIIELNYDETDCDKAARFVRDDEKYEYTNLQIKVVDIDENDGYSGFITNSLEYTFEKDITKLSLQAKVSDAGVFKITSIIIDGENVEYSVNWGCDLFENEVCFTDQWGELGIDTTNAKAGSKLVITLE